MIKRAHLPPSKKICKNEIRQIEFNDKKADHVRKTPTSVEDHIKEAPSVFKPKWMRSSDESQKISRKVQIKRWLLQSIRPKHYKKKHNTCQKEQLIVNIVNYEIGLDNPGFVFEELEEEDEQVHSTLMQFDGNVGIENNDQQITGFVSENVHECGKITVQELEVDCPDPWFANGMDSMFSFFTGNVWGTCMISTLGLEEVASATCNAILPLSYGIQEGYPTPLEQSNEKEHEFEAANYDQLKREYMSVTKRLMRKEKRNNFLMKRQWEMTATLVKQTKTITRQEECIEMKDRVISDLESKLKKLKKKPLVVNNHINVEYAESFMVSGGRDN
ncbi:uncharacterized protein [Argopecten irradians]|uniref:uncharacterized protein n=1 Tax=Argopecten irradians TaxID=31199 RepID=UPI0037132E71